MFLSWSPRSPQIALSSPLRGRSRSPIFLKKIPCSSSPPRSHYIPPPCRRWRDVFPLPVRFGNWRPGLFFPPPPRPAPSFCEDYLIVLLLFLPGPRHRTARLRMSDPYAFPLFSPQDLGVPFFPPFFQEMVGFFPFFPPFVREMTKTPFFSLVSHEL